MGYRVAVVGAAAVDGVDHDPVADRSAAGVTERNLRVLVGRLVAGDDDLSASHVAVEAPAVASKGLVRLQADTVAQFPAQRGLGARVGESIEEATITNWFVKEGDEVVEDDVLLEIATDKVDSEVPSEVDGVLVEKMFNVEDVVQVGQTIAIIEMEGYEVDSIAINTLEESEEEDQPEKVAEVNKTIETAKETVAPAITSDSMFYSPLVRNITKKEGIYQLELD